MLTNVHIIGILLTIAVLVAVSIIAGRGVKDARSFAAGGKSGSWIVCGAIMGTLVGGQSTIGTAQLAFSFGLSAWWFTIGAALGALVLGLVYAKPLRQSGCTTVLEVVGKRFGKRAETVGSVLFLIGIFISIMSQLLSSSAMFSSIFGWPMVWAMLVGAILIAVIVLVGGIKSAGTGGIVKLVLLYICSITAGMVVLMKAGGLDGLMQSVEEIYTSQTVAEMNGITGVEDVHRRYGNMLARGAMKDLGGCLSLMLGIVCTQTYAQAIWSAATTRKAQRGALLCAAFIPLIGAACTLVGLFMRGHFVTDAEAQAVAQAGETLPAGVGIISDSLQAFPAFILNYLPSWIGGIAIGTLIVNILGCGAGLVLGASTIVVRDVYANIFSKWRMLKATNQLAQMRLSIVLILAVAAVAASLVKGSYINDLGFLSLGLRAVAILLPLSIALWMPNLKVSSRSVVMSMPVGVAVMLCASMLVLPGEPLYYGLLASAITILVSGKMGK